MVDAGNELTIYDYRPAENVTLAQSLIDLRVALRGAAESNVRLVTDGDDWTETEIQSMILVEELRQVNGLELAAILMRAELLRRIDETNAIANHPAGYTSREEMARDQGISVSELSQTLDLVNIIFPFLHDELGLDVTAAWEQIGKSNFRELVPVMKAIIQGSDDARASVRASAERILDDVATTFVSMGNVPSGPSDEELAEWDDEVRHGAIAQLVEQGATLTNRELRRHIRPERTPSVHATVISDRHNDPDHVRIIMKATEEQYELLVRRLGAYIDTHPIWMPNPDDQAERERTALMSVEIRDLLELLGR